MACVFYTTPGSTDYKAAMLRGRRFALDSHADCPVTPVRGEDLPQGPACLLVRAKTDRDGWAIVASPQSNARLAGDAFRLGVRALADRDQIVLGDRRLFFSMEDFARVEPYVGPPEGRCRRCHTHLVVGDPAVMCKCGLWFHQVEDRRCFDFPDPDTGEPATCPMCSATCSLEERLHWTPESER